MNIVVFLVLRKARILPRSAFKSSPLRHDLTVSQNGEPTKMHPTTFTKAAEPHIEDGKISLINADNFIKKLSPTLKICHCNRYEIERFKRHLIGKRVDYYKTFLGYYLFQ
jgi:hypothetical protein